MDPRLKIFVTNLTFAVLTLVLINAVCFAIELMFADTSSSWQFGYAKFSFYVNNEPVGLPFKSLAAKVIVGVVFVALMLKDYDRVKQPAA